MSEQVTYLAPPLTPEQLKINDDFQSDMRKRYRMPVITMDDHARQVIKNSLGILRVLSQQLATEPDEQTRSILSEKCRTLKIDVCLWLVQIGYFASASVLCPDKETAATYLEYARAEDAADNAWCEHPRWINGVNGKPQPNYYREFDYFSEKRGRRLTMTRCSQCQMRNAVDLPADLRDLDLLHQRQIENHKKSAKK